MRRRNNAGSHESTSATLKPVANSRGCLFVSIHSFDSHQTAVHFPVPRIFSEVILPSTDK